MEITTIAIIIVVVITIIIFVRMSITPDYEFQSDSMENENENENKNVIPRNLFQTWHTKNLPPKMQECVDSLKRDNPELQYHLYDDGECRDFIKMHFEPNVLYSYDTLVPGAFKADLWRYCVLYKLGGVYLDIKYECINGFKLISLMDEEHFVKDREEGMSPPAVYNAFMICRPGNAILLKCIDKIVEHVSIKFYGTNALAVTGPIMMMQFFNKEEKQKLEVLYHDIEYNRFYIYYKMKKILMMYPEYRKEQVKNQLNEHYAILWRKHQIYH